MSTWFKKQDFVYRAIFLTLFFLLFFSLGFYVYNIVINNSLDFSRSQSEFDMSLFKSSIQNNLEKAEGSSVAISGSISGWQLFIDPSKENIDNANNILDRYKKSFGISVIYLIDKNGNVLASSNRNDIDSFVGSNYSFRPYFKKAIAGETSHYVAFGVTSNKYGYYIANPIIRNNEILGVVVAKQDADALFGFNSVDRAGDRLLILDKSGVVIFSNYKLYISSLIWPISSEENNSLKSSGRLGPDFLDPIFENKLNSGELVSVGGDSYYFLKSEIPNSEIDIAYIRSASQFQRIKILGLYSLLSFGVFLIFILFVFEKNRRVKKDIFEKEKRFNDITSVSKDWVWETDKNGLYTYTNSSVKDLLGYEPEEIVGKSYLTFLKNTDAFNTDIDTQKERHIHVHKNGKEVIMESYKTAVKNDFGKIIGFKGIDHDITESEKQYNEVSRLNKLMIDRELKMIELKKENEELKNKK